MVARHHCVGMTARHRIRVCGRDDAGDRKAENGCEGCDFDGTRHVSLLVDRFRPAEAFPTSGTRIRLRMTARVERHRLYACVPLVAAVFPIATETAGDLREAVGYLDALQIFCLFVSELALNTQTKRRPVAYGKGLSI
jgi:hypothetical protein